MWVMGMGCMGMDAGTCEIPVGLPLPLPKEDGQHVMGTILMRESVWIHVGKKWNIRNGVHFTSCHGLGHQICDSFLAPYTSPYNQRPPPH